MCLGGYKDIFRKGCSEWGPEYKPKQIIIGLASNAKNDLFSNEKTMYFQRMFLNMKCKFAFTFCCLYFSLGVASMVKYSKALMKLSTVFQILNSWRQMV